MYGFAVACWAKNDYKKANRCFLMNDTAFNSRLGALLQEAREKRDMSLSDVAGITHVRKEYLQAIDEGRWNDLPENVYTRNFLRLYASTVGVNEGEVLNLYAEERYGKQHRSDKPRPNDRRASQASAPSPSSNGTGGQAVTGHTSRSNVRSNAYSYSAPEDRSAPAEVKPKARGRLATALLSLIILGSLGVIAWQNFIYPEGEIVQKARAWYEQQTWLPWLEADNAAEDVTLVNTNNPSPRSGAGNDATLSDAGNNNASANATADATTTTVSDTSSSQPEAPSTPLLTEASNPTLPSNDASDQVFLTIRTEPEGAKAYLDNFELGLTPVEDFPTAPANSRLLRIEYEGYTPIEEEVVLVFNRNIFYELDAIAPAAVASSNLEGDVTAVSANPALANALTSNTNRADTAPTEAETSGNTSSDPETANAANVVTVANDNNALTANSETVNPEAVNPETATSDANNAEAGDAAVTTAITAIEGDVVTLSASEGVWLEVYTGEARGDGERLAYQMLEAGQTLQFPLPVFVHAGNSQALQVTVDGQALGAHGDDVTGKRYP